jgi:hypothetical protein
MENTESKTKDNIRYFSSLGREGLGDRINSLNEEWDAERFVGVSLTGLGLFGLVTGFAGSRLGRMLVWTAMPLLLMHALGKLRLTEGIFRSMGFRSRREIEAEKYALKALRGDFQGVEAKSGSEGEGFAKISSRALEAARA